MAQRGRASHNIGSDLSDTMHWCTDTCQINPAQSSQQQVSLRQGTLGLHASERVLPELLYTLQHQRQLQ